ncbi:MAG: SDR family oxidoreductase, partial [Actinomycetota bacterium]|nr:SDR family oxidoreductase [Actinomycetota bacterium]
MGRLDDKVALISGAGTGIGREAAKLFAHEGARVVIADVNSELGEAAEASVREAGGDATFVRTDVTDESQVLAAVETTVETYGKLNVLYNCAGGSIPQDAPVTDVDMDVWEFTMSLDLKGPFLCCRHGIPKLIEAGGGTIVNMSSTAALMGMRMHVYSAAKGGVISLTKALARQYSRSGVRVNAICPGYVLTDRVTERFSVAGPGGEASQEEKARQRWPYGVG